MPESIQVILEDLTGQKIPFQDRQNDFEKAVERLLSHSGIGYSQFNELLLLLGYDRVQPAFFQFLLDGEVIYETGSAFKSLEQLRSGVDRFRIRAITRFGSVKYGFKYLSTLDTQPLWNELSLFVPVEIDEFSQRHDALIPIDPIPGDQTYYLGYLIERELEERRKSNPDDPTIKAELGKRKQIVEAGKKNHIAYLASDHMDVYVATSMRERHEYQIVSQIVADVFTNPELKPLKVRWFDPTQAYCEDRIDKGLVEGLMLKRAFCTLYLAQESDTLGKDSELASTLAQGKPVIAFIPSVAKEEQDAYVNKLIEMVKIGTPELDDSEIVLKQLRVFRPEAAWADTKVKSWLSDKSSFNLQDAKRMLGDCIREHYDKRANTLKESHPLGIQVHLETGVANGVLVARTPDDCAKLIRRVLTRMLEFEIDEKLIGETRYILLREKISKSVFRVVTGDTYLTNAFWNFYLTK